MDQESPTLELTNDCFRFVTGFYEVISLSAPHIYHSALLLSPKKSIVQTLYGLQANPLARFVQGTPTSWDPNIANARFPSLIHTVAWSPCSRFIAVGWYLGVAVLDAVTLEQLHTMHLPVQHNTWEKLLYSPDSHLLTGYSHMQNYIVSWDLQTGGLISNISMRGCGYHSSMTYSGCGTMLGILFVMGHIAIYNVLSGIKISSHSVQSPIVSTIWTYGECLQFATVNPGYIIIWEVNFTSNHAPIQIGSLPTPDNFSSDYLVLLPTLSQFAFIFEGRILVWDAQYQKILLDSVEVMDPRSMSFSPDGHFFVCRADSPEFYLWKKSPDVYLPCKTFAPSIGRFELVISPSGKSIISFGSSILQLWPTTDSPTSLLSLPTTSPHHTKNFLLEFSPDESLMAVAQWLDNTVSVFNLKSGNTQLVINADTQICGIRITESRVVIVGDGKIVTWELPTGDCVPNAQKNINNSLQTTTFNPPAPTQHLYASISPDLKYAALAKNTQYPEEDLYIYNMYTGEKLAAVESSGLLPGFTSDGKGVWCATWDGEATQWGIFKDDGSNITKLELMDSEIPLRGFPWHSSYGYQVTSDGWVLNSNRKYLLWLPHQWRSKVAEKRWSGKILALLHSGLPEAVILELEV